jgi:prepilin-type N-terminal cleavage/methylation domain-containing protein
MCTLIGLGSLVEKINQRGSAKNLHQIETPKTNQKGFTLVEIAIVMVIVGLLMGGVLKGQEMIFSAKLKRIENNNVGIAAAVFAYQDRYQRLPGDDDRASTRFSLYTDSVNDPADTDINGNSDGVIDGNWIGTANSETANFWKHMRAAGLFPGGGDDNTQPSNAFGGKIGIRNGSLMISGHVTIFGLIEGPIARILEARWDDGIPATGFVQADVSADLMDDTAVSSIDADYLDSAKYFLAFRL